jgi:mono/diheme cytochrome c family protein
MSARRVPMLMTALGLLASGAWVRAAGPDGSIDFNRDVRPILQQHCGKCHGANKQQGGLRFDLRDGAMKEGDSGQAAIVAGQARESGLIQRVVSPDENEWMPPEGPRLSSEQVAVLTKWIDRGAPWPQEPAPASGGRPRNEMKVTDEDRQHWAFRPLAPAAPIESDHGSGAIDRLISQAQAEQKVVSAPAATAEVLVRRIYFDLIGLPPAPEQAERFAAEYARDPAPAVRRLVDELLASPRYGERWGRHWLDVARYADSNGQEGDQDRPFAYRYRDFVIQAFNGDLPFNEFVRWQLAGDELQSDNPEAAAATGFFTAGSSTILDVPMEEEKIRNHYNELDDMLSTLGQAFLGLTVGCARCHDHKFDAIPTRDYYRLIAILNSGDRQDVLLGTRAEVREYQVQYAAWNQRRDLVEQELKSWLREQRKSLEPELRRQRIETLPLSDEEKSAAREQPEQGLGKDLAKRFARELKIRDEDLAKAFSAADRERWETLQKRLADLRAAEPPSPPKALGFRDFDDQPRPQWLFERGDFYDRDEPVTLGFLTVLCRDVAPEDYWANARRDPLLAESTQQRRALADWITDLEHGAGALLARVIVNRVWQHHFGAGLVRTPNDFGVQGDRPAPAPLLEWLARDFVDNGWQIKRLHRQILLTSAYARGAQSIPVSAASDPENRTLWRHPPRRLEAEILRDAMLSASGQLNLKAFGPGFKPPVPAEAQVARNLKTPYIPLAAGDPEVRRRSVYMFHKRIVADPLLQAFDRPDASQSCGRRDETTVAPQALALLNDGVVRSYAESFARRLLELPGDDTSRITAAYRLALSRSPQAFDLAAGERFLQQQIRRRVRDANENNDQAERQAWTDYCQMLFCLNEFLYVD